MKETVEGGQTRIRATSAVRRPVAAASLAAASLCSSAFGADAVGTSCASGRVVVEQDVGADWNTAIADVCSAIEFQPDVDRSVRLRLTPTEEGLIVVASLGDGRTAERRVATPSELRSTVEALVTLPPTPAAPSSTTKASSPERDERKTTPPEHSEKAAPQTSAVRTTIEVGAGLVGRVWGPPSYVSAGANAYAGLRPGSWLFALLVRWDPFEMLSGPPPPAFEMDSVGAGFIVARRIGENPQFDLGATASLVEETQSIEDSGGETSGSQTDVRLGAIARLLLGGSASAWHGTVSLEADVSPGRFRRTVRITDTLPDLPLWSLGLGVGAAWEDR